MDNTKIMLINLFTKITKATCHHKTYNMFIFIFPYAMLYIIIEDKHQISNKLYLYPILPNYI